MRPTRYDLIAIAVVSTLLASPLARAVDGVSEINETSIVASGGYPFAIGASGSYVLTSNLRPPPGVGALVAGTDNIEIDLNGFTVLGSGPGGQIGIESAGFSGITVRGGVVQGFSGIGVELGGNGKLLETRISGNGTGVAGVFNCLIVENVIESNSAAGIEGEGCKIENNVISLNGTGIIGANHVIVHNNIRNNPAGGILDVGGSTIQQNMLTANGVFGISDGGGGGPPPIPPPTPAPARSNLMGNVVDNTFGGPGISYQMPTVITNNTVSSSEGDGIFCGAACSVRGNTVETNNTGGFGVGGVVVADGSNVHGNAIGFNAGAGLTIPLIAGYTNNTLTGNAPDVVLVGGPGPSVTGPGGTNNCSGAPCP